MHWSRVILVSKPSVFSGALYCIDVRNPKCNLAWQREENFITRNRYASQLLTPILQMIGWWEIFWCVCVRCPCSTIVATIVTRTLRISTFNFLLVMLRLCLILFFSPSSLKFDYIYRHILIISVTFLECLCCVIEIYRRYKRWVSSLWSFRLPIRHRHAENTTNREDFPGPMVSRVYRTLPIAYWMQS